MELEAEEGKLLKPHKEDFQVEGNTQGLDFGVSYMYV